MTEAKVLLACCTTADALAWAQQAACDALEEGKVYEVRLENKSDERVISWHQVGNDLPILGACMPHRPDGASYNLLGRFVAA